MVQPQKENYHFITHVFKYPFFFHPTCFFLFEDHTNSQIFLRFCLSSRSGLSSAMSSARPMRRRLPYRVWRCLTESGHSPLKLTAETHEKMASQKEMNTLRFKFPVKLIAPQKIGALKTKLTVCHLLDLPPTQDSSGK